MPDFSHSLPHLALLTTLRERGYYPHFRAKRQKSRDVKGLAVGRAGLNPVSGLFPLHHTAGANDVMLCAWLYLTPGSIFFFCTFYFEIISIYQKAARLVQRTPVYPSLKFTE